MQNLKLVYDRRKYCKSISIQKKNIERTYIDINRGDTKYWKAIDDSHDLHEVEKVQKHIGDREPTNFQLNSSTKIDLQIKDGKVVDVHPKNMA